MLRGFAYCSLIPYCQIVTSSSLTLFLALFSIWCPPLVFLTLFAPLFELSVCVGCLIIVISYLGYLASLLWPVYVLNCLCVTGMTNLINVPYTWVYRRLSFLASITQVVVIANTLVYHVCSNYPFFDDAKRGKIGMTMVVLVWLGLSWFLKKDFSSMALDYFGTNLFLPFHVNMVIWFLIIKKEEFADSNLM